MLINSVYIDIDSQKYDPIDTILYVIAECSKADEEYVTFRFETTNQDYVYVIRSILEEEYNFELTELSMSFLEAKKYRTLDNVLKKSNKKNIIYFLKVNWVNKKIPPVEELYHHLS